MPVTIIPQQHVKQTDDKKRELESIMKYQVYFVELKRSVYKFKNSGHKFDSWAQQMRALVKLKPGQWKISKLKHRENRKAEESTGNI